MRDWAIPVPLFAIPDISIRKANDLSAEVPLTHNKAPPFVDTLSESAKDCGTHED